MTNIMMASDESLYAPRPIYPFGYKFIDKDCEFIANYIANEVNETFYDALRYNVIKSIRTFNDLFVPLTDFPVLKVYRSSETNSFNEVEISTKFKIIYALAFTQKTKVADISSFVGREIRRVLSTGSLDNLYQIDWGNSGENTIDIEYEDFIAPDNTVYKYVTVTCPIFTLDGDDDNV
jgi:hypothetical protein